MLTRLLPAGFTAVCLVAVYWVYALAVVPLIEPDHSQLKAGIQSADHGRPAPIGFAYADLLATYFPPGHWTRARPPKVLENQQVMLIFAGFEELEDGRVELKPAALIFFPNPRESDKPLPKDAVVMEAPDGALFKFEGGLRSDGGRIGKFDWGELKGDVTIRGNLPNDGRQSELLVKVSDVQINERRIWSNNDVAFQLGSSHGTGTKLEVRFLPAAQAEGPHQHGLDIGGVLSVEITKNVDATMHIGESDALFGPLGSQGPQNLAPSPDFIDQGGNHSHAASTKSNPNATPDAPVRVTCDGSFIFHFGRQFAQFDKNVRVARANPTGPPDLLTCEMLDIFFEKRQAKNASEADPTSDRASAVGQAGRRTEQSEKQNARDRSFAGAPSMDLQPTRLVAFGAPVRIDAPSNGASAKCERLTYELDAKRVVLETITPGHAVSIDWNGPERLVEIESPALSYEFDQHAPRERIGTLRSAGPGWLRATETTGDDDSVFMAEWTDRVDLQRDEGQPVLSLYGSTTVSLSGLGQISGNETHLWLQEPPAGPASPSTDLRTQAKSESRRPSVLPDRMGVLGNVQIDSPQLVARLGQLHVWFRHVQNQGVDNSQLQNSTTATVNHRFKDLLHGKKEGRKSVYEMEAGLLQLELAISGMATEGGRTNAEVKHVWTTGGLMLQQRPITQNAPPPLVIRGDRLHVENADTPAAIVELFGKADSSGPDALASILAKDATFRGQTMHLDRAANRISIPGAGDLTIPLDRQFDGRPLARPQQVTISWNDRLDFDGNQAVFSRGVRVRGADAWMQAEKLTATMHRKVDFSASSTERIDIDRIRCEGDVVIDRRERDASGVIGHEHFEVPFLSINRSTGDIEGRGPGWMRSVRHAGAAPLWPTANRQQDRPTVVRGQSPTASSRIPNARVASSGRQSQKTASPLRYLRVDFQNRLDGNLQRREMQVEDKVHAIYGPVDSWEHEIQVGGPAWKNGAMALRCDRLSVTQMKGGPRRQDWAELDATGNVDIEGYAKRFGAFAAQAYRLTYDQQKDTLVLDGGTSDARLWRENSAGDEKARSFGGLTGTTVARKIIYSRSRNHAAMHDARSIDMGQFR